MLGIESFHSVLKKEEVNFRKYKDAKAAYNSIFEYIESWYNRKRIHSSLNDRTPETVYSKLDIQPTSLRYKLDSLFSAAPS